MKAKNIILAVAATTMFAASAQSVDKERYAIKPYADMGIGNTICMDTDIKGLDSDSYSFEYGIDFGWNIWKKNRNYLEANVGVGYSSINLTADLSESKYNYSAPASADMDKEPYIRYYQLDALHQKIQTERITIPIYLNYRFKINKEFSIHALVGFKFGINFSSKITNASGNIFSYGVYPQYDNLMIDAPYMNEFGHTALNTDIANKPKTNVFTPAFLAGIGIEFRIWGPLAASATIKYEGGMDNLFRNEYIEKLNFDASNAPVTYTVAEGQRVKALTSFFDSSKISRLSGAISLLCRF